jgi:hypothetical protein
MASATSRARPHTTGGKSDVLRIGWGVYSAGAMWMTAGGGAAEVDRLILEAASGTRQLTRNELRRVLEHVARAGFHPTAQERVRGRLDGVEWKGRFLKGSDVLSASEVHYLWHVVKRQEWPTGTSPAEYIQSIRQVVLDPASGAFTNRYQGAWCLGAIRESRELRGPRGQEWVLVQYRLGWGHWTTAFQPEDGLDELHNPDWSDIRWLRRPRRRQPPPAL